VLTSVWLLCHLHHGRVGIAVAYGGFRARISDGTASPSPNAAYNRRRRHTTPNHHAAQWVGRLLVDLGRSSFQSRWLQTGSPGRPS